MAKNTNLSFTITIGNIAHTFIYYPKRNTFRVSSHQSILNETKYKEFTEPSLKESRADSRSAYLQARLFFKDVLDSHLHVLFAPIENKYYELPF